MSILLINKLSIQFFRFHLSVGIRTLHVLGSTNLVFSLLVLGTHLKSGKLYRVFVFALIKCERNLSRFLELGILTNM